MAKLKEKEEAIRLRKLGKSYMQIRKTLSVSKGSLSLWLKDYPLSVKRIRELRDWNEQRIEHYRETRSKKREELLNAIYSSEKKIILPMSKRDLFIGGLFLYWGEGGKSTLFSQLTFSNTDPGVIKYFILWVEKSLGYDRNKIKIKMHFYKDMDIQKETLYWSKVLKVPSTQFTKPYIKNSKFTGLSYKRGFGHGTCNVLVHDAMLGKKIMMGLKVVGTHFMGQ